MSAGLAALDDQAHIANSRAHNMQWRDWLVQQIGGLGISVRNTQANFILLQFADAQEAPMPMLFYAPMGSFHAR